MNGLREGTSLMVMLLLAIAGLVSVGEAAALASRKWAVLLAFVFSTLIAAAGKE